MIILWRRRPLMERVVNIKELTESKKSLAQGPASLSQTLPVIVIPVWIENWLYLWKNVTKQKKSVKLFCRSEECQRGGPNGHEPVQNIQHFLKHLGKINMDELFQQWAIPGICFFMFVVSTSSKQYLFNAQQKMPMNGFEPGSSGIRSVSALNSATTLRRNF